MCEFGPAGQATSATAAAIGEFRAAAYPLLTMVSGDGGSTLSSLVKRVTGATWSLDEHDLNVGGTLTLTLTANGKAHPTLEYTLDARHGFVVTAISSFDANGAARGGKRIEYETLPSGGVRLRQVTEIGAEKSVIVISRWSAIGPDAAALRTETLLTPGRSLVVKQSDGTNVGFHLVDNALVLDTSSEADAPSANTPAVTKEESARVPPRIAQHQFANTHASAVPANLGWSVSAAGAALIVGAFCTRWWTSRH